MVLSMCESAGFSKISEAGRAPQANVPAPEIDTWPSRPRCQRCGRRPGRRIQCPICGYLVGPGCCCVHAQNRCRFCIHPEQPEPEPSVAKTKFSPTSASGECMKATVQVSSSISLKRLPVAFVEQGPVDSTPADPFNLGALVLCGLQISPQQRATMERRRAVATFLLLAMIPKVDAAQSKRSGDNHDNRSDKSSYAFLIDEFHYSNVECFDCRLFDHNARFGLCYLHSRMEPTTNGFCPGAEQSTRDRRIRRDRQALK